MKDLGVNHAVLTAKHGCGFYLWPTNVTIKTADGHTVPYTYHVNVSAYGDILRQFTDTMSANGIGHGFYYSLTNNFYLNVHSHQVQPSSTLLPNQINVTQQGFEDVAFDSVKELWTQFGNLTEIWFDGGYTSDMKARLTTLLTETQPNAVCFGGVGICQNPSRWCGAESPGSPSSLPGYPDVYIFDCGEGQGGGCMGDSPNAVVNPSAVDVTLQEGDHWFYTPGDSVHPLPDLINFYHLSVGANAILEIDFAIDRTGNVDPVHALAYRSFGNWIRSCYGTPLSLAVIPTGLYSFTLSFENTLIDRVMLQEDLVYSQLVTSYKTEYLLNGVWTLFSSGITIGNKRIDVGTPVNTTGVRCTILSSFDTPRVTVSVYESAPCTIPQTKVKFVYSNGQCLISNSTFPCPGNHANTCPVFLGDCNDPTAIWDDSQGEIASIHYGSGYALNIDCDNTAPHTVVKLLNAGGNSLAFLDGQIRYGNMCFNGGQGPVIPPCDYSESYRPDQIQIDSCASSTTTGWTRQVV
jgi:hypothetical protein